MLAGTWTRSCAGPRPEQHRAAGCQARSRSAAHTADADVRARGVTKAGRLRLELLPLPFGDHLDGAVNDLDGRLLVDGVGRGADVGGPPLGISHGVRRESVQVREDREVHHAQGAVVRRGRPLDERGPDPGRHHHASGTHSQPNCARQRRQQIGQPGLPHPVAQVCRVAAIHQEGVGIPDPRNPSLRTDSG